MNTNIRKKKTLITGVTGFVGSHLAQRLVNDEWDIHIIVRPESNLQQIQQIISYVTLHFHDGSTEGMSTIVEKVKPEVVFHLASLFLAQHESKDVELLIKSNVLLGTQLVEAMIKNEIYQLINTGTSWQHYENKDYSPVCLYAATKQAFEAILKFYTETTLLKVITLKLFDTYGPNDPRHKLFNFLRKVAKEQKPLAMSPGEQLIDLVYIDDVIDAFILASERLQVNNVNNFEDFAVSSGKPIKLRELVEYYSHIVGKCLPVKWGCRPYRAREVMVTWKKGCILPNWQPQISLFEGIKRMEHINE